MMWLRAFVALIAFTGSAEALSCMRPAVETSYARALASDDAYVIVRGVLRFDESKMPKSFNRANAAPKETRIKAHLSGVAMSKNGFDARFQRDVMLLVQCLGPWCGGLASKEEYLVFLRRDASEYTLEVGPCGGWAFGGDTDAHQKAARQCYETGRCTSVRPKRH